MVQVRTLKKWKYFSKDSVFHFYALLVAPIHAMGLP